MATVIDARVKQKTGTAADFAGFTLIEGEIALVRSTSSGAVINYKVGPGLFDSLPWSLQVPGTVASVSPSTDFDALPAGLYLPDSDGTYDGTVSVDLTEGVTYLNWDGSTLTKQLYPINLSGYATKDEVPVADVEFTEWQSLPETPGMPNRSINAESVISTNSSFSLSDYISVEGYDSIEMRPTTSSNYSTAVGLYLGNNTPFGSRLGEDPLLRNTPVSYGIPTGVRKVVFYWGTTTPNQYQFEYRLGKVKSLEVSGNNIDIASMKEASDFVESNKENFALAEAVKTVDLSTGTPAFRNRLISPDSSIASGGFGLSDYIPVPTGTTHIRLSSKTSNRISSNVGFYGDDQEPAADRVGSGYTTNTVTYPIDSDAIKYCVFYLLVESTSERLPLIVDFIGTEKITKIYTDGGAVFDLDAVDNELEDHEARIEFLENNQDAPIYLPRPSNGVVNFQVPVNCAIPNVTSQTLNAQDSEAVYDDWGVLFLPTNYMQAGKPIRLIIGCHGTGTWITGSTSAATAHNFWLSQGFALMDMNGIPSGFVDDDNTKRHLGAPFALQSYLKGYEYVIKNYNIAKDGCFVYGISMGGLSSMMMVQSGSIPVLAQGAFAPVTDHFKQAWCDPWMAGTTQRADIAAFFGFEGTPPTFTNDEPPTQAEIDYYFDNIYKVLGYNPMLKLTPMSGEGVASGIYATIPPDTISDQPTEESDYNAYSKLHPVPLKIWHNLDDNTVKYRYSRYFVEMCKRAGTLAELRTFPSGGHNAWLNGANVTVPSINGGTVTTQASMYECMLWFKRFE